MGCHRNGEEQDLWPEQTLTELLEGTTHVQILRRKTTQWSLAALQDRLNLQMVASDCMISYFAGKITGNWALQKYAACFFCSKASLLFFS